MNSKEKTQPNEQGLELSLFCTKESGDAWRVRVLPTWLPKYLRHCFDEHGEAYPVYLDLEELDRKMTSNAVTYVKRESSLGGYELAAVGLGAQVLAVWLSQSIMSGSVATGSEGAAGTTNGSGMTG